MCGIIGALAGSDVQAMLLEGLKRMEYRGYDSAGMCLHVGDGFDFRKEQGKLENLRIALRENPLPKAYIGIAHTRWATHGAPTEYNAHPHLSDKVAVIHNGIIENHAQLRMALEAKGVNFASDTDSEVIPWLFSDHLARCDDPMPAWRSTLDGLDGAYAIVAMLTADPEQLWFARRGSPLILGRRGDAVFAASDVMALAGIAEEVMYLDEGDYGCLSLKICSIYDAVGQLVDRAWKPIPIESVSVDKGGFRHYMEKEIHEQPGVLADILQAYVHDGSIQFPDANFLHVFPMPARIVLVACGTSYHAALTARYWLERYLQVSVEVDMASEYRYRDPVIGPNTWLITLSQSGETADTLEALRLFKKRRPDNPVLALCNVAHSSLHRESDGFINLHAGPEIGVASTKAFTAQLGVLSLLVLLLARRSGAIDDEQVGVFLDDLHQAVSGLAELVESDEAEALVPMFDGVRGALYLGRGPCFPLALEGALKLKEISYLHAEGYAAGEMKHGPIALIDSDLPVVVIAPREYHIDKVLSNLQEVQARGAKVILITDLPPEDCPKHVKKVICVPEGDFFTAPILSSVPLQLLAYHVARHKGADVDQPRNLAKSVTVE
ncbi:MAG: glutamine--fructose-6-phosphate transaminase (isomerizing) [Mariprofundaceae bacterium]